MSVSGVLFFSFAAAIPSLAATFGTVVARPQPIADLALDEVRKRLYVVDTNAPNQIAVYSLTSNPPRQTTPIKTDSTPLSIALSRSGKYLYVACYNGSSLDVIDLMSPSFAMKSVSLAANPEAVAVGFDDKAVISTIGTSNGQDVLVTYDPNASASNALTGIAVTPPAPAIPTLPPPSSNYFLASHSQLLTSQDGHTIVGVNELANNTRTVFVYDVASATVIAARNLAVISPVLAISPDGSKLVSGPLMFDTKTLLVRAQQSTINSPYVFANGANFNTQANQGGAVFSPDGSMLYAAYNIAPVASPAARSNISQLLLNASDNMLIQMGIQLPENLNGKMVISSDGGTIYALSQSGFTVLPINTLRQMPLAIPDSNVALLASDQCGATAAQNSAVIPVRNVGGRTLTATVQLLQTAQTSIPGFPGIAGPPASTATSPSLRVTPRPYGGDITAAFNPAAARSLGTVTPDQLLIQSPEAVNIIPNVRVFQNNRNAEARGTIMPVDIGSSSTGLTDMLPDAARQRLYIANPGLNRIEVFDPQKGQFLASIRVGQLPRSMAFGNDSNTLYVANSGGENISIVDLNQGTVVGAEKFPPIPFNGSFAVITPQSIASSQHGPQVLMSDGTLWKIAGDTLVPRTLNPNIFGTARSVPAPQTMVSTPDGSFVMLLAGNGSAYLYSAAADDFVNSRQVAQAPIVGYYGPVAAGPNGAYYLTNDLVLNQALTPLTSGSTISIGPITGGGRGFPPMVSISVSGRPVSAVAAVGPQTFSRFSNPTRTNPTAVVTDAGLIELMDMTTLRTIASANALEGPLTSLNTGQRANISGRTMAVDVSRTMAYVATASGLSIIPLTPVSDPTAPKVSANGVVSSANYLPAVAPGGLVSIFGTNLASSASASLPLPAVLGGSCVTLNNAPLPLLGATGSQINAQLPPTLAAGSYPLVVRSIAGQQASNAVNVRVSKYAPAVFVDASGPAIFHKDSTRVDKDHPASRDEPLIIYATGLGTTTGGRVTAGAPAPASPLAVTGIVQVYFGNPLLKQAQLIVDWSGLLPGYVGVYQINVRIPGAHVKGDALPVLLKIGGVSSATGGPTAPVVYVN